MPGPNPVSFIPPELQQRMFNALIDFLSEQAQKVLGDEVSSRLKGLRSDAAFAKQFEAGLKRAGERFLKEYEARDEDLTAAIADEPNFFKNEQVQTAMLWMLKHPGTDLDEQREVLVQSFATVLPARKQRSRVDQAVMYFLKCLTEELWTLPELQPIYSLQFQRMTAEATRQQVELQKAQLHAQLELNSGIREALLQLTDAIGERKLLTVGEPGPQVLHNLPQPDHGRFVGREDEVKQIIRILRPYPHSQHSIVTIDGIGGIGKSALALEVAHRYLRNYAQIPPEERFDAIIWTSAKQNVLTAEGIVPRQQALRTLDDIYTAIAITLQREGITRVRPEEQTETVRNALTRQRTLLIVDNLETVDDKAVMEFLRELPAPTKAMVTTRHRLDVAYPVRLTGMPWDDAQLLIADECAKKNVNLTQDNKRRLYERTGGVPLALTWSIAQMGFGHGVDAVLARLGQPNNDVARFCFEGAVKRISGQSAHQLLMALSLFATDANRTALGKVADLAESDQDDGLVVLEMLSLVNKDGDRFSMLPLTKGYGQENLSQNQNLASVFRDRWAEYLLEFAVQASDERLPFEVVSREVPNILGALDWCWENQRVGQVLQSIIAIGPFLWDMGRWRDQIHYYEIGLKAARLSDDELLLAYLMRRLADVKCFQGDLIESRQLARGAASIYRHHGGEEAKKGLVSSLGRLASAERELDDFVYARRDAMEALAVAQSMGQPRRLVASVRCRIARIDIDEGQYDAAHAQLELACQINDSLPPNSADYWMTPYLSRLQGIVAFHQGRYESARAYLLESLVQARAMRHPQEVAQSARYLALVEEALGHDELARQTALEALKNFEDLNMGRQANEVRKILEQLDAKQNT
jgi:tetratricopeptide (TPR) repeat protein